ADAKSVFGLSGFGDLVATCNGVWSRNRTLGQQLGEGLKLDDLMRHRKTVVEGVMATSVFHELCRKRDIEAPILNQIHQILFGGLPPLNAIEALMLRDLKSE
ncbi:MAG: glycerol-3-phosphate dehydrogenase, partial [Opitutae bacterium]|nr:glycerol-3-phosphate dehydrogenase [Opitutae bacterium]